MIECKHCFQPIEKREVRNIYMHFSVVKEWFVHCDKTLRYQHQAELRESVSKRKEMGK